MNPGLIVALILVVGTALVVVATIVDRRNERAVAATPRRPWLSKPQTSQDADPPAYLSPADLLAGAQPAVPFSAAEQKQLEADLAAAPKLDLVLAAPTLATHTGNRAILERPLVLVCADQVDQIRELLPVLGTAAQDRRALLIAAPAMDADTLQTVIANKLGGKVEVAVVFGTLDALTALATATATDLVPLADRQAGLPTLTGLGRASRIVANEKACWVISADHES